MIKKNQTEEKQQVPKDPYAEPASEYNDLYKQYVNLERDFRDAEKNAEEYRKKASQKEYEVERVQNNFNRYKKENGWTWAGIILSWGMLSAVVMFFTAVWVDGCSDKELYNYDNNKIIVHSIEPFRTMDGKDLAKYYFADERNNTRSVILIDKKGKYNIGDTVKFTKDNYNKDNYNIKDTVKITK